MTVSRGLRQQQAANVHAAEHEEFLEMLLAALDEPEVQEAIEDIMIRRQARRARRNPGTSVSSASAARDLKASRLAARGRQRG